MKTLILMAALAGMVVSGSARANMLSKEADAACDEVGDVAMSIAHGRLAGRSIQQAVRIAENEPEPNVRQSKVTMVKAIYGMDKSAMDSVEAIYVYNCAAQMAGK